MSIQEIDPLELTAYADDALTAERRIAVERWLARHPQAAAQVMTDLHLRNELRLAHAGAGSQGSAKTDALALKLGAALDRPSIMERSRPLLAACLLVTLGWVAHDLLPLAEQNQVPHYVIAAVDAHHTTELRTQMHLQTQPLGPDTAEMLARTQIKLPRLPEGWTITDVQLYPSEFGPSIEVALDTGGNELVSIFAAHPGEDRTAPPVTREVQDTTTAYWQSGDTAYALVASASSAELTDAALSLYRSLQ